MIRNISVQDAMEDSMDVLTSTKDHLSKSRSQRSTRFPGLLKSTERLPKYVVTLPDASQRTCVIHISPFYGTFSLHVCQDVQTGDLFLAHDDQVKANKRTPRRWI